MTFTHVSNAAQRYPTPLSPGENDFANDPTKTLHPQQTESMTSQFPFSTLSQQQQHPHTKGASSGNGSTWRRGREAGALEGGVGVGGQSERKARGYDFEYRQRAPAYYGYHSGWADWQQTQQEWDSSYPPPRAQPPPEQYSRGPSNYAHPATPPPESYAATYCRNGYGHPQLQSPAVILSQQQPLTQHHSSAATHHGVNDSTGPKTRSQTRSQTGSLQSVAVTSALQNARIDKNARYSQANVAQSGYTAAPPSGPSGVPKVHSITRPVARSQGLASSQNNMSPHSGFTASPPKGPSGEAKVYSISRPVPLPTYLATTCIPPSVLEISRPLLVILDLNGTLLYRKNKGSNFLPRPHLDEFLEYLFSNHIVMVWSSARPHNVINMCKQFFSPEQYNRVAAIWTRDNLHLTPEAYKSNTQVYKQLSWVWRDPRIQATNPVPNNYWDQSNTVLLDDSVEKSASEPFSLIRIDEFEGRPDQKEEDVLPQVALYLNTLRSQRDASAYIRSQPFEVDPSMPRAAVEAFAVARHAAQAQSQFLQR